MNKEDIIRLAEAISNLSKEFSKVCDVIEDIERANDISINDVSGFCEEYPFCVSFDEMPLSVALWAEKILEQN